MTGDASDVTSGGVDAAALGRNVRLFVWYRVLFNARFYYPVIAVFFTDMGLSVGQFLWLNALWALTIVVMEVPSGVLADLVGRRRLVVFSAVSMLVEMVLLLVAPMGGGWVLFGLCACNRVLSGLAEAAASGADEALAYDSLQRLGEKGVVEADAESGGDAKSDGVSEGSEGKLGAVEERWDGVLVSLMRWQSAGMVVAMLIGGVVFDHVRMEGWFGEFPRWVSLKLPIFLCLLSAVVCVVLALRLTDVEEVNDDGASGGDGADEGGGVKALWSGVWRSVQWLLAVRWLAWMVVGAVILDMVARTLATLTSTYYRGIGLPEWSFGVWGAAMALGGWVVPLYVRPLVRRYDWRVNVLIAGGIATLGLVGVAWAGAMPVGARWWGVVPCFVVLFTLSHGGFLLSRYVNREAPSRMRASVLSVASLSKNVGYGVFSGLFAWRLKALEEDMAADVAFLEGVWLMPLVMVGLLLVWGVGSLRLKKEN